MLDFDSIQNALQKLSATADAAESHGTLCGFLFDCSFELLLPDDADDLAVRLNGFGVLVPGIFVRHWRDG